jgi:hypothetical protein
MQPLSVRITTNDAATGREVHYQYFTETRHPRWELIKILLRAMAQLGSAA